MESQLTPFAEGYRGLGLYTNPLIVPEDQHVHDSPGARVSIHSASTRMLVALMSAAEQERPRPLWLYRNPRIPTYYGTAATTEMLRILMSHDEELRILPVQIGLEMLRESRIRGTLGVIAELVMDKGFGPTLAEWSARAFDDPDTDLPEWVLAGEYDAKQLSAAARENPVDFVNQVFGSIIWERTKGDDADSLIRFAGMREANLPANPEESDNSEELQEDDALADVLVTPSEETEEVLSAGDPESVKNAAIREYVIAFTAKHLSPVVARGIAAFVAQGTFAAAQEIKMTKAPKKTLGALLQFASMYWRSVALIFTRFDPWGMLEQDLRQEFVGAFAQLRLVVGEHHGIIAFAADPAGVPEIAETFPGGETVSLDYPELEAVQEYNAPLDMGIVSEWLRSASIDGVGARVADSPVIKRLADESDGKLDDFIAMAGAAIEDAAVRGVTKLDKKAQAAGIAARPAEAADSGAES